MQLRNYHSLSFLDGPESQWHRRGRMIHTSMSRLPSLAVLRMHCPFSATETKSISFKHCSEGAVTPAHPALAVYLMRLRLGYPSATHISGEGCQVAHPPGIRPGVKLFKKLILRL